MLVASSLWCVWLLACGNQVWSFDDEAPDGGGPLDVDAADALGPDVGCDGAEPKGCGPCGIACGDGERCQADVCECLPSRLRCGAVCVAVVTDPSNCGGCGVFCPPGTSCRGGACE